MNVIDSAIIEFFFSTTLFLYCFYRFIDTYSAYNTYSAPIQHLFSTHSTCGTCSAPIQHLQYLQDPFSTYSTYGNCPAPTVLVQHLAVKLGAGMLHLPPWMNADSQDSKIRSRFFGPLNPQIDTSPLLVGVKKIILL